MNLASELRKLNEPLTIDVLARVLGYSPASVQRVVLELKMPAAMFVAAYSYSQAKAIVAKIAELELDAIDKNLNKGSQNVGLPQSEKRVPVRPTIGNVGDAGRAHYEARRAGRVGR
jgi:hypothetical protein